MGKHETFALYFIEDGKTIARRWWIGVPRVGDFVMLSPTDEDKRIMKVVEVMWGVAVDDGMQDAPSVNVLVERRASKEGREDGV